MLQLDEWLQVARAWFGGGQAERFHRTPPALVGGGFCPKLSIIELWLVTPKRGERFGPIDRASLPGAGLDGLLG